MRRRDNEPSLPLDEATARIGRDLLAAMFGPIGSHLQPPGDVFVCRPCNLTITRNHPGVPVPKFCAKCGHPLVTMEEAHRVIDVESQPRTIEIKLLESPNK